MLVPCTVPAQRDPQWLMPLYFQDANGDRDTVYFGYDPEASLYSNVIDEFLGEKWIEIDTAKFNIYLWYYPGGGGGEISHLTTDIVRKVDIRSIFIGTQIGFCKGKMPITMKWVDSLLYAPSCPFTDLSPRPRARIDLTCDDYEPGYYSCPWGDDYPLSLTDYPAPEIYYPVLDSMLWKGSGLYPPSEIIINTRLNLVAHNYEYVGLNDPGIIKINVFPNPFDSELTILNPLAEPFSIKIMALTGKQLFIGAGYRKEATINLSVLNKGLYLLIIQSQSGFYYQKIIKY
jgi:hypothetical protein